MYDPPNEDDIIKVIKLLLSDTTRHERMLGGTGVMLEALITVALPLLKGCDGDGCSAPAVHSCGGKHKRFLCDYHLAAELKKWKTKEAFEAARDQWSEMSQAAPVRLLEEYMDSVSSSSMFPTVH